MYYMAQHLSITADKITDQMFIFIKICKKLFDLNLANWWIEHIKGVYHETSSLPKKKKNTDILTFWLEWNVPPIIEWLYS